MKYYLAIDLGASSGRHIVGHLENGQINLDEVHRFSNGAIKIKKGLVWDTKKIFNEILIGIKKALQKYPKIESLAIDSWGVDYVLLNKNNKIIEPCYSYRNNRTLKRIDEVHKKISFENLYKKTGIQFASYNTIYQLFDDLKEGRIVEASDFLMLPQYFAFLLTGIKMHEYTDATTTGLVNAETKEFDLEIIKSLGLPAHLFPKLNKPGDTVGYFKKEIEEYVGGQIKVVLAPSHDTACAFEAIDAPKDSAIISSGTWSLIGYKIKSPCLDKKALNYNFTNEGGVGYIRFLKNIMGMWVPNQIQKLYHLSIQEMVLEAKKSKFESFFDVNNDSLIAPLNMEDAIKKLLGKNIINSPGDLFRSIYLSLAKSYDKAVKELEDCLNIHISSIYIVGGGAKNNFLNDLVENVSGKKVIAIPIEATATGNIKSQIKEDNKNII